MTARTAPAGPGSSVATVKHPVGNVDDFELNRFRVFEIDGRPVGVVRTSLGFFACRNRCPHQGADICAGSVSVGTMAPSRPMEFALDDEQCVVACPWHRWEFDLHTGRGVQGITAKKLVTYEVRVEGDEVAVLMRDRRRPVR